MRKLKTSLICSLLGVAVTLTLLPGCAAGSSVPEASAAGSKETFPVTKSETVPEHSWQYAVSFPDWKGKPDNSLAMNSMVSLREDTDRETCTSLLQKESPRSVFI